MKTPAFPSLSLGERLPAAKMPLFCVLWAGRRFIAKICFRGSEGVLERLWGMKLDSLQGRYKRIFPLWQPRKRPVFLSFKNCGAWEAKKWWKKIFFLWKSGFFA